MISCCAKKESNIVRTIIAYELLHSCIICKDKSENLERSCKVMSLFRQENGGNAILHCMTVGAQLNEFEWVVVKVAFRDQTAKFKMTQARVGTYVCKLNYDDEKQVQSQSCKVECTKDQTDFTLDAFRKILDEWFENGIKLRAVT